MKKFIASLLAISAASAAQAAPVQWTVGSGGNGHYYDYIGTATNWADARAAALASTHLGQSGYLVTITSAAENAFVGSLSSDGWIGASDQAVEGEWRWVDGPESGTLFWLGAAGGTAIGYASWNGGEPNDYFGFHSENYAQFSNGNWNDLPGTGYDRGYYIEYANVPEPAAWAMLISGFGLLGAASRRRRIATVFA